MKKRFFNLTVLIIFFSYNLVLAQNQNIPPEVMSLMPPGIQATEKNWTVEPTTKMLLQANLTANIGNTKLENTQAYELELNILMTVYNLNSMVGKMTADQSLKIQRQEMQDQWMRGHGEKQEDYKTFYKPEKMPVTGGYILIQKIFHKAHVDGEGNVPESTHYCGFLYMDMEAGWLTAEVQPIPNTKAGIEKWLKHIAAVGAKLDVKKYFK
jgi:hypothetical protein